MASLSGQLTSATAPARPEPQHLQTCLARLATALGAVIGLSAMAAQGAVGGQPILPDGTYLYGESPVANTIGAVYFVFEVKDSALLGAVYQPSSSFDCVYGNVTPGALDLTVIDAYDQTESAYSMALTSAAATVATSEGTALTTQIQGMQPIQELSAVDRQLLATCAN
ncbi:MAG: hypothetical protein ACFCVD_09880 [Nodosilinea sp.]